MFRLNSLLLFITHGMRDALWRPQKLLKLITMCLYHWIRDCYISIDWRPGLQLHFTHQLYEKTNNTLKENDIKALTTGYVATAVTVWFCLWFSITGSLWQVWNISNCGCETIDDIAARGGVSERDGRLDILMTPPHLHINEYSWWSNKAVSHIHLT